MSHVFTFQSCIDQRGGLGTIVQDLQAMRRDAKVAGKESQKALAEAEKVGNEDTFINLHKEWLEASL